MFNFKFNSSFLFLLIASFCVFVSAIDITQLYDTSRLSNLDALPRGDDQYQIVNLDVPVHLYTDKYDLIYVSKRKKVK